MTAYQKTEPCPGITHDELCLCARSGTITTDVTLSEIVADNREAVLEALGGEEMWALIQPHEEPDYAHTFLRNNKIAVPDDMQKLGYTCQPVHVVKGTS